MDSTVKKHGGPRHFSIGSLTYGNRIKSERFTGMIGFWIYQGIRGQYGYILD